MTDQNTQVENIPNFRNSAILHGFFGILEFLIILITLFVYVSSIVLLIANVIIISGLISVLGYAIIFKNPFYYISCAGLICITIFPSSVSMIFFISFTKWSYEPVKIFVLFALAIEALYIYLLLWEISHNKYTHYFHRKYGRAFRGGNVLNASFYSTKEFDKLDKGRQYWQDQKPEEAQNKHEELRAYKKKFRKHLLVWIQILSIVGFNIIFGISLLI